MHGHVQFFSTMIYPQANKETNIILKTKKYDIVDIALANIDSRNCLFPDGTKLLYEPVLIYR